MNPVKQQDTKLCFKTSAAFLLYARSEREIKKTIPLTKKLNTREIKSNQGRKQYDVVMVPNFQMKNAHLVCQNL